MKIIRIALFTLLLAAGALLFVAGCGKSEPATGSKTGQLYTCGMHPQVIQDHPGNCPICGMKLTPVRKQDAANDAATRASSSNSSVISIDAATTQTMDLRTGLVTRGPVRRMVRTVGVIDFDETAIAEVSTKFKG